MKLVEECFRARKQNHRTSSKSELLRKRKKASVTSAQGRGGSIA